VLLDKVWLNTKEVAYIGNCSRERALKIKKEINEELLSGDMYVHRDVVPAYKVINKFALNDLVDDLRTRCCNG